MNALARIMRGALVLALALSCSVACRRPTEAVTSDLAEVGYQLTAADWMRASRTNDVSALKKFLAAGFDVGTRDEAGDSALHAATAAGAQSAADYLLDRGLAVDERGADQRTPLMAAVLGGHPEMLPWLLRQGADIRVKDAAGFTALMLAVRENQPGAVEQLAPYHRENLDAAILLAALLGQTEVIDTLTNYGASIYARMEDGRTPLMVAAENGHSETVKLLVDLGASRFGIDSEGRNAADLATAAGHNEIAAFISQGPQPDELAFDSPEVVAATMDALVNVAATPAAADPTQPIAETPAGTSATATTAAPSRPIHDETLSVAVAVAPTAAAATSPTPPQVQPPTGSAPPPQAAAFPMPPLVMRHFRHRELPVQLTQVTGDTATLRLGGSSQPDLNLRVGQSIPGSRLVIVRLQHRLHDSKLNLGRATEVSWIELRDPLNGTTRKWIAGVPAGAHDPVALVEDAATGRRYTATPGQRFKSSDGAEFIVNDVRPNQIIIEDAASGAVQTLPLRGPRG